MDSKSGILTGLEYWVAVVQDDYEALQAAIIASSPQTMSSKIKKIVLTRNQNISKEMRKLLERKFDMVVPVENKNGNSIQPDIFENFQILKQKMFKKSVPEERVALVIGDEMFEKRINKVITSGGQDATVFIFKPSIELWNNLGKSDSILDDLLEFESGGKQLTNISIKTVSFAEDLKIELIEQKLFFLDDNNNEPANGDNSEVKMFLQIWSEIFVQTVIPFISKNNADCIDLSIKNHHLNDYNRTKNLLEKYALKLTPTFENSIAVVGMSCRFPGANNPEEYWELISAGQDAISVVPEHRWNPKTSECKSTRAGFLKCCIEGFDGKFFRISPHEAQFMDPQQRLLLEVAWESLENAGINPSSLSGSSAGVFIGLCRSEYERYLKSSKMYDNWMRTYMGNCPSASIARLSFHLGLNGPNIATESGCSSSMVSVHLACASLRRGECNLALAGGVNLLVTPFDSSSENAILSSDGRCKTFDEKADGFVRSEGCGVLVLKKLSSAMRDKDRILGIIRGSGMSYEGSSPSFGTPSEAGQTIAIKNALQDANVNPLDISYVEAHGTGTKIGDPIEISALAESYGKNRSIPLIVGSVKTNIGHTESAAGIAGLIKVILSMEKKIIPPHINFKTLNPLIDLKSIPAEIPLSALDWEIQGRKHRIAGVSSFGLSGTNVHVILQESSESFSPSPSKNDHKRPLHILTLSAKSERALDQIIGNYESFLNERPDILLEDVVYTANTGRAHFSHRTAVIGATVKEIHTKLQNKSFTKSKVQSVVEHPQVVGFLFTGQGSDYEQMGKELYDTHPIFKDSMDFCSHLLRKQLGFSFLDVIWGNSKELKEKTIDSSLCSQISIFCLEYSLLQLWKSFGISPHVVVGHSLGEFAAAVAAEIISLEDALQLVFARASLFTNIPEGGMMAVKIELEKLKILLQEKFDTQNDWIDIACINSEEQIVLSGPMETLVKFKAKCTARNIKTTILSSTRANHSRDMDCILPQLFTVASRMNYKPAKCKFISAMTGALLQGDFVNAQYWVDHCRHTVNFLTAIKTAELQKVNTYIEIGPHPVLLGLAMANISQQTITREILWLPSLRRKESNWETLCDSISRMYVSGGEINWEGFESSFCNKKIPLPTYPFQRQKYWFDTEADGECVTFKNHLLHPLLGKKISSFTSEHIYQNFLDLENLPYLADHQVAGKVILPCSAILEILMAGGQASLERDGKDTVFPDMVSPLMVENFKIECPLEIEGDKSCPIQTLVKHVQNENSDAIFQTSLYKQVADKDTNKKWVRVATGEFSLFGSIFPKDVLNVNLDVIKLNSMVFQTDSIYAKFPVAGLKFGKAFQSIQSIWKNSNEILAHVQIEISDVSMSVRDFNEYLCHPVICNSIIQSFLIYGTQDGYYFLHFPVEVQQYILLDQCSSNSKDFYVHAKLDGSQGMGMKDMYLYDENGKLLAALNGIKCAKSTVCKFLSDLNTRKSPLPSLYQETWRSVLGHEELRLDWNKILSLEIKADDSKENTHLKREKSVDTFEEAIVKISYLYIVRAFRQLGWNFVVGKIVQSHELQRILNIQESLSHHEILLKYLDIFVQENILELVETHSELEGPCWLVIRELPLMSTVQLEINSLKELILGCPDGIINPYRHFQKLWSDHLSSNLQKQQSVALNILFSGDKCQYASSAKDISAEFPSRIKEEFLDSIIDQVLASSQSSVVLRILEIGTGTGNLSFSVLSHLEKCGISFHYTYTDISTVVSSSTKDKFAEYSKNITFKVLDIEKDPLAQGFAPFYYDIIIATNIFHATNDAGESVRNIRRLLTSSGYLMVYDPLNTRQKTFPTVLEGYWGLNNDFGIRPHFYLPGEDSWINILKESGFSCNRSNKLFVPSLSEHSEVIIGRTSGNPELLFPESGNSLKRKCWILATQDTLMLANEIAIQLENVKRCVFTVSDIVSFNSTFEKSLTANYELEGIIYFGNNVEHSKKSLMSQMEFILHISQYLMAVDSNCALKFIAITQGMAYIGDQISPDPSCGALWGFMRTFKNENPLLISISIDVDPNDSNLKSMASELCSELFSNDGIEYQIAFRNSKRYILRLTPLTKSIYSELKFPNSERFIILPPKSKSISDLKFSSLAKKDLSPTEVEISVRATSLNSRDLMLVLNPDENLIQKNKIGSDYSGTVSKIGSLVSNVNVGDDVYGFTLTSGTISSHTYALSDSIGIKPSNITHVEAAALPTAFLTAYYSLVHVANIKSGDKILIQCASDSIGLCAIQIAKIFGTQIIATGRNRRECEYLRKLLGSGNVFHSTINQEKIENVANIGSLDLILNCATEKTTLAEIFLAACKQNARIVQIGPLSSSGDLNGRPDIKYTIVDLEEVDFQIICEMTSKLSEYISKGEILPLPYKQFNSTQFPEALFHLQERKQIGKIVLTIPKTDFVHGKWEFTNILFSNESTYLVTVGCGGIGLEVARFLANFGAKHIILVGRNTPSEYASSVISNLTERGIHILAVSCDVGDFSQCEKLLADIRDSKNNFPPLRGIMHAAGLLSDGVISNQTTKTFDIPFGPKVHGAWNLHCLTLKTNLEHFVLFSSISAILAPTGQSSYSSANSFLDALADYRHSLGLVGTSVNWGPWSEVGMSTNAAVGNEGIFGLKPFSPVQGITALSFLLTSSHIRATVLELEPKGYKTIFPHSENYLEEISPLSDRHTSSSSAKTDSICSTDVFWDTIKSLVSPEEKDCNKVREFVQREMQNLICHVLSWREKESLGDSEKFVDLGMDSLMAVVMKNKLQAILGKKITVHFSTLSDYPTLTSLTDFIVGRIVKDFEGIEF